MKAPYKYPLWRLIKIIWKSSNVWSSIYLILLVVMGLMPLVQLYIIKTLIDTVSNSLSSPDITRFLSTVFYPLLLVGIVFFVSSVLESIFRDIRNILVQYFTDHINSIIHSKSVTNDLEYYESSAYHDTLHRAQQEASYRPQRLLSDLSGVVQSGITILAISGLLCFAHWSIMLLLVIAVLPEIFTRIKFANMLYRWARKQAAVNRLAYYYSWMLTRPLYAKDMKIFGLGNLFADRYKNIMANLRKERTKMAVRNSAIAFPGLALGGVVMLAAYTIIAYLAVTGKQTIGGFVMYFQGCRRGFESLKQLQKAIAGLYENNLFLTNLFEFLDLQSKVKETTTALVIPNPIIEGIKVENVAFNYPGSKAMVLENINMSIKPGEFVAIAGRNGCGKTTLIKLLCRLYDPCQGSIKIDNRDLRDYSNSSLRNEFSVMFQDWVKYQFTAKDNIWFGRNDQPSKTDFIRKCADMVNACEFIENLPHGYDTNLGSWFEISVELSSGEWQKMALARTLYRDAQIIILDEPTTSFDVESEIETIKTLRSLAQRKIIILVNHNLSTLKMVDRIYVLDDGHIVEQGSHAELLEKNSVYVKIFQQQIEIEKYN